MIILVTGSSGFLGAEIINEFKNEQVITLARKDALICSDLSKHIPEIPPVDIVVHAAGKAHFVPKTPEQHKNFYAVNVNGTQNLLAGIARAKMLPKAFVFISSVAVYGRETGHMITEDEPKLAQDSYGASKIQAENIIQSWCEKNNVICAILRLPLIAAANPPGNLKAMVKGISKGYYFNIAGGKAKKSIVLADDVAKIILSAAQTGGIYNLTDSYHPNFLELSTIIAEQLGTKKPFNLPLWVAKILAKLGDLLGNKLPINSSKLRKITSDLTFDDSKAKRNLNWHPTKVLNGFKINAVNNV